MIEVWMLVMACWPPNYTACVPLETKQYDDMEACELDRPPMVGAWQTEVYDGWRTFSICDYVNPEQNGRMG